MKTIVLMQRFEGRVTDVGPGLLDVALEVAGGDLADALPVSTGGGVREIRGVAVIFVTTEEES